MSEDLSVRSRTELQKLAARMAQAGAPQAVLFAAAAAGKIAVVYVPTPDSPWPAQTVARLTRPAVVLLAGDPGYGETSSGPGRWRCARKAKGWAASAIVHGGAGERDHYVGALAMAELMQRVLMVETTSALVDAWGTFLAPLPRIGFRPSKGVHPVQPGVVH
jgi:hypothetical protein